MGRIIALVCTVCLLAAVVVHAELQTVKLKDGTEITADVTKVPGGYQIREKKGNSESIYVLPADKVEKVMPVADPEAEYKDKLSKIDPKSADAHFELAQWAFKAGKLEIAKKEAQAAVSLNKDHALAPLLLRQIEAAMQAASTGPAATPTPTGTATTGPGGDLRALEKLMLSEDDMARIRLAELRLDDVGKTKVDFKNKIVDSFLKAMSGTAEFYSKDAADQFRAGDRTAQALRIRQEYERDSGDVLDDIQVKSDPAFMTGYRKLVWPIVMNSCGSIKCHGAEKGQGRLKIFNLPGKNDKMDYTNFVILDGVSTSAGKVIDRDVPENSLILQYGLPEGAAKIRHPRKINDIYSKGIDDPQYLAIKLWIESLRPSPHPDYRLTWKPPFGMVLNNNPAISLPGTTKPATAPAVPK